MSLNLSFRRAIENKLAINSLFSESKKIHLKYRKYQPLPLQWDTAVVMEQQGQYGTNLVKKSQTYGWALSRMLRNLVQMYCEMQQDQAKLTPEALAQAEKEGGLEGRELLQLRRNMNHVVLVDLRKFLLPLLVFNKN